MKVRNALLLPALILVPTTFAMAQDPESMADDTWTSLTGTATSTEADSFRLDYGDGVITVEMDDWDTYGDAYGIVDGDEVTVYGVVDNDFYEEETIEARSVYIEDLNTYFYASAADEEEVGQWAVDVDAVVGDITYVGTVESVSPGIQEMTIDTGIMELTVDTSSMLYNPLDDEGFQQIETGDRVSVEGTFDSGLFDDNELIADTVITLSS